MEPRKTPPRAPAGRVEAEKVSVEPLTAARWADLERLFGTKGACGGCWCTWWRQSRAEYRANSGDPNRRALKAIVDAGTVPGLLAYADGEPVGWVAVQPRSEYAALARSRTLAPVDDAPVWSVTCFFVAKTWRGRGLMRKLLDGAVAHARAHGATIVEGYPVESSSALPAAFVYTGVPAVFEAGGFEEVARRSRTKPIYRRRLVPSRRAR
jgi:GNAT superfamily N-acetyltransferase